MSKILLKFNILNDFLVAKYLKNARILYITGRMRYLQLHRTYEKVKETHLSLGKTLGCEDNIVLTKI